ncbi:MAG: NADPH-dependent 7-cyano-7-deazaguanine reductase QueF [Luminiphilus sp.]|jgi:7-cyano-7-deazaguanine reductase|nr:NADPH-dependent 7-cyano-7-deazaguanine reductase QueF [Luminiphilus sp.]MDG1461545.1 NADPH-dependent 7-cyano-7-deazaguanine reductase QueF [Luminiphilus sp.]
MPVQALGKKVAAPKRYAPDILEAISRQEGRDALGPLPKSMVGHDCWHLYELSWLNSRNEPQHCVGVLQVDSASPATIESKSLKLYLNSLNFHCFASEAQACEVICSDIGRVTQSGVSLTLLPPDGLAAITREPAGLLLEAAEQGVVEDSWCDLTGDISRQILVTHRLRSLCPVTAQPDWGTLVVDYLGHPMNLGRLLSFVESFREHQEFHEQCVERCFTELMRQTCAEALTVSAFYQRRGGIDITPVRSSHAVLPENWRTGRQ